MFSNNDCSKKLTNLQTRWKDPIKFGLNFNGNSSNPISGGQNLNSNSSSSSLSSVSRGRRQLEEPLNQRLGILQAQQKTQLKNDKDIRLKPNIIFILGDDHGQGDLPWKNTYLSGKYLIKK